MKVHLMQTLWALFFAFASSGAGQTDPKPTNPSAVVRQAFETHDIVMSGEIHNNKQEYQWLQSFVANPEFADRVDDIMMELGNSLVRNPSTNISRRTIFDEEV